jgi:hypothetical protein
MAELPEAGLVETLKNKTGVDFAATASRRSIAVVAYRAGWDSGTVCVLAASWSPASSYTAVNTCGLS